MSCNDLKIITLNVRGLRQPKKRNALFEWLKHKKFDIICLQETYCTCNSEASFNKAWNGKIFHSISNSMHSRGVCTMISNSVNCKVLKSECDNEGRKLMIKLNVNDQILNIINIYAPNCVSERRTFIENLSVQSFIAQDATILMGDFNTAISKDDRRSGRTDCISKLLSRSIQELDLLDTWKKQNPSSIEYTWTSSANKDLQSRIDYIFMSKYLLNFVSNCDIVSAPFSDHKAVVVKLKDRTKIRGPGYWKLNVSVLKEDLYCEQIVKIFKDCVNESLNLNFCKRLTWDLFKIKVKEFSIKYCQQKAQRKNDEILNLENNIKVFDRALSKSQSELLESKKEHMKAKLAKCLEDKASGAQVRSRAKYMEEGEKSTSYFLKLEKQRQVHNSISKLKVGDNVIEEPTEILDECKNFYKDIYTSTDPNIQDIEKFLHKCPIENVLSENQKNQLV